MNELAQTINAANCGLVLIATPIDLGRLLNIKHPNLRVTYKLKEAGQPTLKEILQQTLAK